MRTMMLTLLTVCLFVVSADSAIYLREESGVADLGLGTSLSTLEDQNGDGVPELLVGAPGYQAAGQDAGAVLLWFGGNQFTLNADQYWIGSAPERFGYSVARIGDVNGDGVGDWAVGAPLANNAGTGAGRVYVYYGDDPLPTTPDLILEGPVGGINFGWSVAAVGDFNGDGRDDFVVGAPLANSPSLQSGAAYVFYGRNGDPNTTADLTLAGEFAYQHFGWSVAGVAEFMGGNANCLAVGAPSHATGASLIQGSVYVFQGTTSGSPDAVADLVLQTDATAAADNEFGFSVAGIGSFDGDSDPDLAVGIPMYSGAGIERGRVEIFFGGLDADETSDRYADGPSSNSNFGWSVAGVGDVEGSSLDDLLVGAPFDDIFASNAGRAFLWPGGYGDINDADSLPVVDRGEPVAGTAANDNFGFWCASAGDLDGDGLADYALSAPAGNVSSGAVAGWVRVIDSSDTAVPVQLGVWNCRWNDDGEVEGTIAVAGAAVERVTFARLDPHTGGRAVLHDGTPVIGGAVERVAGGLRLWDVGAAAVGGELVYSLDVTLDDGTVVSRSPLSGPVGATPLVTLQLAPAQPNPFNPRTTLRFRAAAGQPLDLRVYDLRGRLVDILFTGPASGGWQTVTWDGRDEAGRVGATGVYLVRLRDGAQVRGRRVVMVR